MLGHNEKSQCMVPKYGFNVRSQCRVPNHGPNVGFNIKSVQIWVPCVGAWHMGQHSTIGHITFAYLCHTVWWMWVYHTKKANCYGRKLPLILTLVSSQSESEMTLLSALPHFIKHRTGGKNHVFFTLLIAKYWLVCC